MSAVFRLCVSIWPPAFISSVASPIAEPYFITLSPFLMSQTANLCPNGIFVRSVTLSAVSPFSKSSKATAALSFSLIRIALFVSSPPYKCRVFQYLCKLLQLFLQTPEYLLNPFPINLYLKGLNLYQIFL